MTLYKPKCFARLNPLENINFDESRAIDKDFRVLYYMIFKEIDFEKVFDESDFKDHEQHKYYLIKCIVDEYIRIKTTRTSKQITLDQYDKLLRTKLTRLIHFSGQ